MAFDKITIADKIKTTMLDNSEPTSLPGNIVSNNPNTYASSETNQIVI
jgi:hypothetical protein